MQPINEMKFEFISRSANESFARATVAAFISQLDPTISELADIKTAVSEAVTNCIVHAYKNKIGYIYITTKIFENGKVNIKIRDKVAASMTLTRLWNLCSSQVAKNVQGLGSPLCKALWIRLKCSLSSIKAQL